MRGFLFSLLLASSAVAAPPRPHILFLFSDDHALNSISAYGGRLEKIAPTPNIDRIADQGAIFTRSYCCNSICGPSRAAILTGKHSHINGFMDNETSTFDGSQTTFPKLLQKSGYQTAIIGKWHLVSEPQGFDHWEVLPGQGSYYNPDFIDAEGTHRYEGYCTDIITDRAIDWLENGRDKDKPFLLMCQHKAPHRNWAPAARHLDLFKDVTIPEPPNLFDDYENRSKTLKEQAMSIAGDMSWSHDMKFRGENLFPDHFTSRMKNDEYPRMNDAQRKLWDAGYEAENQQAIADIRSGKLAGDDLTRWKYQRYMKDYLRCVRALDENVGRMLDYLERTGLAANTLVVYGSDQGFYLGEHGWFDKRWMFEESLSMPFLARWPGVISPGTRSETMIQNIDYAPTFLDAAGVDVPQTIQGRSLLPVFKNGGKKPSDWREGIYYFYSGEATHQVAAHDGVRNDRYKLIRFSRTEEWNLFDLEKDPNEMKSVHDDPEYATVLTEMKDLYSRLRQRFHVSNATRPDHRLGEGWWKDRHEAKVAEARKGGHDLVFIGDSITQGWEGHGKEVWDPYYGARKALNLGFSGDRTEHVLWRLMNGELDQVDPKLFVIMIGTNNTGHRQDPPEQTADGIRLIVELLRDRRPDAEILLLSVFPRGEKPDDRLRKINVGINELIRPLAGEEKVHWLDVQDLFLGENGVLPASLMPDFLHPQARGYGIWAEAMEEPIRRLMKAGGE